MPADGESKAEVTLRARDSRGAEYGPGLDAVIEIVDHPDGLLSPTTDVGDGSYTATIRADDERGDDLLRARIAGQVLDLTSEVSYGFDLAEVIESVLRNLDELRAGAGLDKKTVRRLGKARSRLLLAVALLLGPHFAHLQRQIGTGKTAHDLRSGRVQSQPLEDFVAHHRRGRGRAGQEADP